MSKMDCGRVGDQSASTSPWQHVQAMVDSKMLSSVPALKLFASSEQLCVVGVASGKTPPIAATPTTSLEAYRETVVYVLHLVYEVHVCMSNKCEQYQTLLDELLYTYRR